jgi:acetylornithine/N-succinyldiaminopimelate aminotransferase
MIMKKYLMDTVLTRDGVFTKGKGSTLYNATTGKWYIDFFGDVGTASLGYNSIYHRRVLRGMLAGDTPVNTPNICVQEVREKAARMICELTGMDRVFFANSGTEAIETAIKLSRKYQYGINPGKWYIASIDGDFHGRTYGSMATSSGPSYHYEGYGALPPGYDKFKTLDELKKNIERTAAVVISPIFGNNDIRLYHEDFLHDLYSMCRRTQTLLVFDEIQTGAGRTGNVTYAQKIGVTPDVLVLGKGIGMGCPVSAVLSNEKVGATFTPGSHFSTFGGNILAMSHIVGMVEWLSDGQNMLEVMDTGQYIRKTLRRTQWAKNVRGVGMYNAFDIDKSVFEFAQRCYDRGLIVGGFRDAPGAVKLTPPLNADIGDIDAGLWLMSKAYENIRE